MAASIVSLIPLLLESAGPIAIIIDSVSDFFKSMFSMIGNKSTDAVTATSANILAEHAAMINAGARLVDSSCLLPTDPASWMAMTKGEAHRAVIASVGCFQTAAAATQKAVASTDAETVRDVVQAAAVRCVDDNITLTALSTNTSETAVPSQTVEEAVVAKATSTVINSQVVSYLRTLRQTPEMSECIKSFYVEPQVTIGVDSALGWDGDEYDYPEYISREGYNGRIIPDDLWQDPFGPITPEEEAALNASFASLKNDFATLNGRINTTSFFEEKSNFFLNDYSIGPAILGATRSTVGTGTCGWTIDKTDVEWRLPFEIYVPHTSVESTRTGVTDVHHSADLTVDMTGVHFCLDINATIPSPSLSAIVLCVEFPNMGSHKAFDTLSGPGLTARGNILFARRVTMVLDNCSSASYYDTATNVRMIPGLIRYRTNVRFDVAVSTASASVMYFVIADPAGTTGLPSADLPAPPTPPIQAQAVNKNVRELAASALNDESKVASKPTVIVHTKTKNARRKGRRALSNVAEYYYNSWWACGRWFEHSQLGFGIIGPQTSAIDSLWVYDMMTSPLHPWSNPTGPVLIKQRLSPQTTGQFVSAVVRTSGDELKWIDMTAPISSYSVAIGAVGRDGTGALSVSIGVGTVEEWLAGVAPMANVWAVFAEKYTSVTGHYIPTDATEFAISDLVITDLYKTRAAAFKAVYKWSLANPGFMKY
jgi:hypothetical protein